MRVSIVIPARYKSSRFPGKPLVKLLNKPMVIWVIELAERVLDKRYIFVATDDKRIYDTVNDYGYNAIMTSENCLTGTDRVAEVSAKINADIIVNIQGDEPLANTDDIEKIINVKINNYDKVVNGMSKITLGEEINNKNVVKVVTRPDHSLLYMSRMLIPGHKDVKNKPPFYWKQSGVYAFNKEDLCSYSDCTQRSYLEKTEDVEILRFLDLDIPVKMVEIEGSKCAVDIPEDVSVVENYMKQRG